MRWSIAILLSIISVPNCTVAAGGKSPVKKEDLRYKGKVFSYWQEHARTELSAEGRIDALHAMAAFGVRGYRQEAAAVILDIVKEYSEQAYGFEGKTPDEKVVAEALWSYRKLGPKAVPVLIERTANPNVKYFAEFILFVDESAPFLIEAILTGHKVVRARAIVGLAIRYPEYLDELQGKDRQRFINALLDFIKEDSKNADKSTLFQSLTLIGRFGPKAKSAIPALLPVLKEIIQHNDLNRADRQFVMERMKELDVDSKRLVPFLIEFLQYNLDEEKKGNREGVVTIHERKDRIKQVTLPSGKKVRQTVYEMVQSRALNHKDKVIHELAKHGAHAKQAVPLLISAYKAGDELTRTRVAEALGAIDAPAKSALPILREASKSEDEELRQAAVAAIKKIEGE